MYMSVTLKSLVNSCFNDKDGKIVIFQFPNIPLIAWLISLVMVYLIPESLIRSGVSNVGNLFLFTWSYLEITQGASRFRSALGFVVMVAIISNYFMQ